MNKEKKQRNKMNKEKENKETKKEIEEIIEKTIKKYIKNKEAEKKFLKEVEKLDFSWILLLRKKFFDKDKKEEIEYTPVEGIKWEEISEELKFLGRKGINDGKIGVLTFAGGKSTRFSDDIPKAVYPAISGISFIEAFLFYIRKKEEEFGRKILWLVMINPKQGHLIKEKIGDNAMLLEQDMAPVIDEEGLLVVDSKGNIQTSPTGHGACFKLLKNIQNELQNMGIEHIVVHNVDNILAKPLDEKRIGFHLAGFDMTISAVKRKDENENVGIITKIEKIKVIEYSIAPQKIKKDLRNLGHINVNIFSLNSISTEIEPVIYTGKKTKINGKEIVYSTLEFLNQSLAEKLSNVGIVEVPRELFFLPVKTKEDLKNLEKLHLNSIL